MSKAFRGLKKVARVALPIAGAYFGGPLGAMAGSALGTKISGGSWGDALKSGALSALTSGITGFDGAGGIFDGATSGLGGLFNSANSGIMQLTSPLRSVVSGITSGIGDLFSGSQLSNLLGTANPGAAPVVGVSSSDLPKIGSADWASKAARDTLINSSQQSSSPGLLQSIMGRLTNPSISDLASMAAIYGHLKPGSSDTMSQQDILNRMQSEQNQQRQQNERFISSLNSAPLQRIQTRPEIDYYRYGESPKGEQLFYDSPLGNPRAFKSGGHVDDLKGQADTVHAKLSVGEYVIPADVVSHLGDGNTDAGAKALDMMLENVRKHKAPALAKGVLPPVAKSPLAYIGAN